MKEACGVFGIYAPGRPVPSLVYEGLYALQHRGQESAGMAVGDGQSITVLKEMGLVASVFSPRALSGLPAGPVAIGHTRYSTTGPSTWDNAQPVYRSIGASGFALGHNGNLTNTARLTEEAAMLPGVITSDSELVAELIARAFPADPPLGRSAYRPESDRVAESDEVVARFERLGWDRALNGYASPAERKAHEHDLETALLAVLPKLEGAFSFGIADARQAIAVRDPHGFRPLCLGRLEGPDGVDAGWVFASESPALDVIGARFEREIEPGEMIVIDEHGCRSVWPFGREAADPRLCVFEFVYFARPDTLLYGHEVHAARRRMGELLAGQSPVPADLVMGVPDSGVPAAEGYALRSGIPYGQGLVKNRYIGRTFIAPTQEDRVANVRRKFNPLRENVAGRRLIVIDDSIVRGTTTRLLVRMLRDAGAREVHLRISSPPFRWPCFYGIDTPDEDGLFAATTPPEEIATRLGADSVEYLTLENLFTAIAVEDGGFCSACLTGRYPTEVPLRKRAVDLAGVRSGPR